MQLGGAYGLVGLPARRGVDRVARLVAPRAIGFTALAMLIAALGTAGLAHAQPEPQGVAGPPAGASRRPPSTAGPRAIT